MQRDACDGWETRHEAGDSFTAVNLDDRAAAGRWAMGIFGTSRTGNTLNRFRHEQD